MLETHVNEENKQIRCVMRPYWNRRHSVLDLGHGMGAHGGRAESICGRLLCRSVTHMRVRMRSLQKYYFGTSTHIHRLRPRSSIHFHWHEVS